jgi:phosphatidylglycerol:prolipoprotein diacylglycerol transferase
MRIFFFVILFLALSIFAVFYVAPVFRGDIAIRGEYYIGPVRISLYGILMAASILIGFFISSHLAPRIGLDKAHVESLLPWLVIFGFLGARLYYVIFDWGQFSPDLWELLKVWHGGLSIYGGVLGGISGMILYSGFYKVGIWQILDIVAVAAPLGQAIGRWGNFFNQEAFGLPTHLPWGMYVEPLYRPLQYLSDNFFHPAFLYESLWDLAVFLILWYGFKTRGGTGMVAGSYLILYSLGRFLIEPLRLDSFFINSFRVDQLTALVMMVGGVFILYSSYERQNVESR